MNQKLDALVVTFVAQVLRAIRTTPIEDLMKLRIDTGRDASPGRATPKPEPASTLERATPKVRRTASAPVSHSEITDPELLLGAPPSELAPSSASRAPNVEAASRVSAPRHVTIRGHESLLRTSSGGAVIRRAKRA